MSVTACLSCETFVRLSYWPCLILFFCLIDLIIFVCKNVLCEQSWSLLTCVHLHFLKIITYSKSSLSVEQ